MDKKISLLLFLVCQFGFSQDTKIGYINSGAISQGKNCGVGEIFVVPEIIQQRAADTSLGEVTANDEIGDSLSSLAIAYPNPVHDYLFLETSCSDHLNITIATLNGKEVGRYVVSAKSSVDVSSLSEGIYLILFSDKKFEPIKFVKK